MHRPLTVGLATALLMLPSLVPAQAVPAVHPGTAMTSAIEPAQFRGGPGGVVLPPGGAIGGGSALNGGRIGGGGFQPGSDGFRPGAIAPQVGVGRPGGQFRPNGGVQPGRGVAGGNFNPGVGGRGFDRGGPGGGFGRGNRGGGFRNYGDRRGHGSEIGAGIAGLAAGAVIGGALANQGSSYNGYNNGYDNGGYAYEGYEQAPTVVGDDDAADYCRRRFRSYDPDSGTYLGNDGERHPCP